jgi:hypothetical protein
MKRNISRSVYLFDFRGVGTEMPCDTIGCEGMGDIQVSVFQVGLVDPKDLYTFVCEACAFNNPVIGIMLEKLEEENEDNEQPQPIY